MAEHPSVVVKKLITINKVQRIFESIKFVGQYVAWSPISKYVKTVFALIFKVHIVKHN